MKDNTHPIRLLEACEIRSGYTPRKALEPDNSGLPMISVASLGEKLEFNLAHAERHAFEGKTDPYLVRDGDILFRSRGRRTTACLVRGKEGQSAVCVLPLYILRPDSIKLLPDFLVWWINQKPSQFFFEDISQGTNLQMVPQKFLKDLPITIPALEIQDRIAQSAKLARTESELLRKLADKKDELMSFALLQATQKAQPHGNGTGPESARRNGNSAGKRKRTDR